MTTLKVNNYMQNRHPLVSILVPVYGVEKYIERCVRSLFEQTYDNIDYVFVDDCTPDNSISVLEQVLKDYPNRKDTVRIIRHDKNKGLAGARNTAVATAKGEYLMHVDSDDWIETNAVQLCLEKINNCDADIVYFDGVLHKPNFTLPIKHNNFMAITKDETCRILARKEPVSIWGALIKATLYRNNKISLKEGLNNGEDYDITPKLCYNARTITYLSKTLYHYNFLNEDSYSHVFSQKKWEQTWQVIEDLQKYFSDKGQEYLNALTAGTGDVLSRILIDIGKYDGGKEYFDTIHQRVKGLNMKYVNNQILYRLALYIPNYRILQGYCKLSSLLKKRIK